MRCEDCLYCDICNEHCENCLDFYPWNEDKYIDEYIESERYEFRSEFYRYERGD